jgi:hypothetical protein
MLDWRSPNGKLQAMSCRKALNKLDHLGIITLPAVDRRDYTFSFPPRPSLDIEIPALEVSLSELGEIVIEPVTSRYARSSQIWSSLLNRYHSLGAGSRCGCQIKYLIRSVAHGYIGAFSFCSGTWALHKRDKHIGWTENARRTNLQYLIKNDRFLIIPSVSVNHLASHVLSQVLSRLRDDWQQRYGIRPVLVETFVNPTHFEGVCYQAANWHFVGKTAGRRDGIAKKIYVYPLHRRWRSILCREPPVVLGEVPGIPEPAHWAEEEFGTVRLFDERLKKRLYLVADEFYNKPMASIPEACGERSQTIATYRFFKNKKVRMDVILTPHTEATIARIKEHRVVLAPQDTTTLDYNRRVTEGLGPINTVKDKTVGLLLHDTLAFSEEGTPLGVLDAQCWARDPKERGKKYKRGQRPIEEKESIKWLRSYEKVCAVQKLCPDTMLVSMGDREADIFELFQRATKDPKGPKIVVRLDRHRWRQIQKLSSKDAEKRDEAGEFELLWDGVTGLPPAGRLDIHIPHSGNRKARDTTVAIRFSEVVVKPPQRLSSSPPIQAWAVSVQEDRDKAIGKPLEWMLVTTVPTMTFEEAVKRVEWYSGRWGIEVYHRTLKSGCRIKDRQLGTSDRLEACLGIDMVVAWRIFHLTMLGRETPDVSCTYFFKDVEWKALHIYANKTPQAPDEPPTLMEAIRMIAKIGGHMGRKSDGFPGTQTMWKGIQRLDTATEMYCIMSGFESPNPMKRGP